MAHYKDGRDTHLSVRCRPDLIQWIDMLADGAGVTRTDATLALLLAIRKEIDTSLVVDGIREWTADNTPPKRQYRKRQA